VSLLAVATAALGICGLVAGAIWPWLTNPAGLIGELPPSWLLWMAVPAAGAALVLGFLGARLRWLMLPGAVMLAVVVGSVLAADPSWMCWDGVDDDGNMIGGCEDDEWTVVPVVFAVGAVLTMAATVIASVSARRQSR